MTSLGQLGTHFWSRKSPSTSERSEIEHWVFFSFCTKLIQTNYTYRKFWQQRLSKYKIVGGCLLYRHKLCMSHPRICSVSQNPSRVVLPSNPAWFDDSLFKVEHDDLSDHWILQWSPLYYQRSYSPAGGLAFIMENFLTGPTLLSLSYNWMGRTAHIESKTWWTSGRVLSCW